MDWWLWMLVGIGLFVFEALSPGFQKHRAETSDQRAQYHPEHR